MGPYCNRAIFHTTEMCLRSWLLSSTPRSPRRDLGKRKDHPPPKWGNQGPDLCGKLPKVTHMESRPEYQSSFPESKYITVCTASLARSDENAYDREKTSCPKLQKPFQYHSESSWSKHEHLHQNSVFSWVSGLPEVSWIYALEMPGVAVNWESDSKPAGGGFV